MRTIGRKIAKAITGNKTDTEFLLGVAIGALVSVAVAALLGLAGFVNAYGALAFCLLPGGVWVSAVLMVMYPTSLTTV